MILNERTVTLDVTILDTVKKVKEKFQGELGICVDHLTLLLGEEQLQDDHLMTRHDVSSGSLLEINLGNYCSILKIKITIPYSRKIRGLQFLRIFC